MQVSVLGMGRMGRAVAGRLLDRGHAVTVWNRTPGRAEPLVRRGATAAADPPAAVRSAAVVLTSVADDAAIRSLVLDSGLAAALPAGATLVDASTVGPGTSLALAAAVGPERFVAMPILGSPTMTASGQSTLLLGGERATVERLAAVWRDLADRQVYSGPAERASVLKLTSNLMLVSGLAVLAEAVEVARAGGVDEDTLRALLAASPMVAPGLANRVEAVLSRQHEGWWSVELAAKDARLAAELAESAGAAAPLARRTQQRFEEVAAAGYAAADPSAVIELVRPRVGQ